MKVESETRDLVKAVSDERRLDYDETIRLGRAALQRESRRAQMRAQSAVAAADAGDLAEAREVLRDMEAWGVR